MAARRRSVREEWDGRNKGSKYIRWYSGDILSDGFVSALSPVEENCYRRLLDFNARDEGIPQDFHRLARMCKISIEDFEKVWDVISVKFQPLKSSGFPRGNPEKSGYAKLLTNARIKFELDRQKRIAKSQSERGKRGGRPRSSDRTERTSQINPKESRSFSPGFRDESHPDPDPEISTTTPRARVLWWNHERSEFDCEPEYPARLEEIFPVRREALRGAYDKFAHWLRTPKRDPEKEKRRVELLASDDLSEWFENRLREDFADELARPRNADEQLADQANDRRRRVKRRARR